MAKRFKVLGINDDKSFCECCGKDKLQRVVWIEDTETGDIKHFGTTCATKPAKGFDCVDEIKKAVRSLDYELRNISVRHQYKALGGTWVKHPTEQHAMIAANMDLYQSLWNEAAQRIYERRRLAA